ncbi:hypothetical protein [Manganibacter manganicus]|uniref:DUF1344 domain-containing protein n=1 Tax=Manganibacter manganicus TaxID=1873176 RepID=A0A1V8RLH9_9HYPH|nr:hypothetical protein [Pseudaminobacter manganicus]OQM74061.1 hypothetical protein BFN67_22975 [Pseudaminobacter manganicus]
MKKIIMTIATLAAFTGTAGAAQISGTVHSVDRGTRVIVLDDGSTAAVPLYVAIPADLEAGSHVNALINDNRGDVTAVFSDTLLAR